jgi:hypothetical protein
MLMSRQGPVGNADGRAQRSSGRCGNAPFIAGILAYYGLLGSAAAGALLLR